MARELSKRLPRQEAFSPHEDDEDYGAHNLARLHIRIMEQRVEPSPRAKRRGAERPSVGRVQHDPGGLPQPIQQEMRGDPETDEPEAPQPRDEAQREDREQEDEGVGPDSRLEAKDVSERFVDQVRQDRSEEDESVVERSGRLPREEPGEPEADPEVAEEEHGTPSVGSLLTLAASRPVGNGWLIVSFNDPSMPSVTCSLSAAPASEERMVGGVPIARVDDSDCFGHDHLALRIGNDRKGVAPGPQGNVGRSIPVPIGDARRRAQRSKIRRIEPKDASLGRVPTTHQLPRATGDGEFDRRAGLIDHRPRWNEQRRPEKEGQLVGEQSSCEDEGHHERNEESEVLPNLRRSRGLRSGRGGHPAKHSWRLAYSLGLHYPGNRGIRPIAANPSAARTLLPARLVPAEPWSPAAMSGPISVLWRRAAIPDPPRKPCRSKPRFPRTAPP